MKNPKRFNGRKKLFSITSKMETDIRTFCKDKNIKSEAELFRMAIAKYIYTDYKDVTLNRHIMDQIQEMFSRCQVSISFK